jgi:hypothetical protein
MFLHVGVIGGGANREKWITQKGRVGRGPWVFRGSKVVAPACFD